MKNSFEKPKKTKEAKISLYELFCINNGINVLIMVILTIITQDPLYFYNYRTIKDSSGKDLWDKVEDARILADQEPNFQNNLQFVATKFYAESGKNVYQAWNLAFFIPVIGPVIVPLVASLTEIPNTKEYTPYSDWDPKLPEKKQAFNGKFVPIENIDWSDILAYWLGGGAAAFQQILIWKYLIAKNRQINKNNSTEDE